MIVLHSNHVTTKNTCFAVDKKNVYLKNSNLIFSSNYY